MRKNTSAFLLSMIALLPVLMLSPVNAYPRKPVLGKLIYIPHIIEVHEHNGYTYMKTWETGVWSGGFEGTSINRPCHMVIEPSGIWRFVGTVNFETDDKTGGLVILLIGKKMPDEIWFGTWVILRGTGDLEGVHGYGTWWGPGAPAPEKYGEIWYTGKIN